MDIAASTHTQLLGRDMYFRYVRLYLENCSAALK